MTDRRSKLSGPVRRLLDEQSAGEGEGASGQPASLLIRLSAEPDEKTKARIERVGCSIGTVAGDVLTASMPIEAVEAIADLDEVVSVDATSELYGEGPPIE
jgi:hypothetical protein